MKEEIGDRWCILRYNPTNGTWGSAQFWSKEDALEEIVYIKEHDPDEIILGPFDFFRGDESDLANGTAVAVARYFLNL